MYYLELRDKIYGNFYGVFMIAMAIVAAIFVMLIIRGFWKLKKSENSRYVAKAVKITGKRTEIAEQKEDDGRIVASTQYYVTYLLSDGEEVEFCVPRDIYEESKRGNIGYLMYEGKRFLAFKATY